MYDFGEPVLFEAPRSLPSRDFDSVGLSVSTVEDGADQGVDFHQEGERGLVGVDHAALLNYVIKTGSSLVRIKFVFIALLLTHQRDPAGATIA